VQVELFIYVLIPFRSGHQSGHSSPWRPASAWRLNPFQIRASVRTDLDGYIMELCSLNPFQIRASVRTGESALISGKACLNPFQIRASVRTAWDGPSSYSYDSLNPFQIRASVRTPFHCLKWSQDVLIPFRSGHQSGQYVYGIWPDRRVLIPFRSGHQSGPTC